MTRVRKHVRFPLRPGDQAVADALADVAAIDALRRAERLLTKRGLKLLARDGALDVVRGLSTEPLATVLADVEVKGR